MHIKILILFISLFTCISNVYALSEQDFNNLLANYYQIKDSSKAIEMLHYIDNTKFAEKSWNYTITPLIGFFAGVANSDKDFLNKVNNEKFKSNSLKELVVKINRDAKMTQNIVKSNRAIPSNTAIIDLMWGYYQSTGDINAVKVIVRALDRANQDPLTATSALWSLKSQAKKYNDVKLLLETKEVSKKINNFETLMKAKKR